MLGYGKYLDIVFPYHQTSFETACLSRNVLCAIHNLGVLLTQDTPTVCYTELTRKTVISNRISRIFRTHTSNMPTCIAVGQGAGVGAALAVKESITPAEVDVQKIRDILLKNKAVLEI